MSLEPRGLRPYLRGLVKRIASLRWFLMLVSGTETRRLFQTGMIFTVMAQIVSACFYPCLNLVVSKTVAQDPWWPWLVAGFFLAFFVYQLFIYFDFAYREMVVGRLACDLDAYVNRAWVRLTPGLHISHSRTLSAASFDADRGKLMNLAQMLIFDAPDVIISLPVQLFCLALLDMRGFLCALIGMLVTAVASVWANEHLMLVVEPIEDEWKAKEQHQTDLRTNVIRVLMSGSAKNVIKAFNDDLYRFNTEVDRPAWVGFHRRIQVRMFPVLFAWTGYLTWALLSSGLGEFGQMGKIVTTTILVKMVCEQMRYLARYERTLYKTFGCFGRLRALEKLVKTSAQTAEHAPLADEPITLQITNLGHMYPGSQNRVLGGINITVSPGTHVAVIGATGSGKSTLAQLIAGFAPPSAGQILVNNTNLATVTPESWWQRLAYITQTPHLLDGTVRDNLLFGLPPGRVSTLVDADLLKVCETYAFSLDSKRFKDGLETRIGRSGVELSGGEKQRLMIAAASLRKASFFLIDEATSALDEATQRSVQQALDRLLRHNGAGSITIAHRLSTIRDCTLFLVLNPDGTQEGVYTSWQEAVEKSPMLKQLLKAEGG